jgi:hypothetical protein
MARVVVAAAGVADTVVVGVPACAAAVDALAVGVFLPGPGRAAAATDSSDPA